MRRAEALPRLRPLALLLAGSLLGSAGLVGCASRATAPADDAPTLKLLAARSVELPADRGIPTSDERAVAAYREFLDAYPRAAQRPQAMRRLADLAMDIAERELGSGASPAAELRTAIDRYEAVLKTYPGDPANDHVLYQLARAHEQAGEPERALQALDRLVAGHPGSAHRHEAQFRRGELLFTMRAYDRSEAAYAQVLASPSRTPFHERALAMQGWSRFKQGRLDEALRSFLAVLDGQLAGRGDAPLEQLPGLSRAQRELVEDTLRVTSLSLQQLDGAASVPALIDSDTRRSYEFRLYRHLGETYLAQDRVKDAAETFAAFARAHPGHAQAPQLQARVIDIYAGQGFAQLALDAKRDYVRRYGPASDFRRANPSGWAQAQPLLKQHLVELARHHHARFQQQRDEADAREAERWYREWLDTFGQDAQAAAHTFALGELLFEARRWPQAAEAYERAAYNFAPHAQAANAGYAALLAHAARLREPGVAAAAAEVAASRRIAVDSARRFAAAFPEDTRTAAVLADAAEQALAVGDGRLARRLAEDVLAMPPSTPPAVRRTALGVLARHAFDAGDDARAEAAYRQLLALPEPASTPVAARRDLEERLAAAVYRQGEAARTQGRPREAAGHFERAIAAAPRAPVAANARFDQATALVEAKDWDAAARAFEAFRREHPGHALAVQVTPALAAVYLELQRPGAAAAEFERLAQTAAQPEVARAALWQAAEQHAKAGASAAATRAYEQYVQRHPAPLEPAVEARWRLAQLAAGPAARARAMAWAREVQRADAQGGEQRTPRTRVLAAKATLLLAEPLLQAYREVRLAEPLARQLKLKKARLETVLQAYAAASESGAAEVVTDATFRTAALYQDFARALLAAPRPKGLKKAEAEQYAVMLEEQAFPFEERAAELHEANARRTAQGLWDDAIRDSLEALARLRPARWGRSERSERPPADLAALEKAAAAQPADAETLNQLGIAYRRAGRFDDALQAYARAAAARPGYATPVLNEAILHDLYRRDTARAVAGYERYQALLAAPDPQVGKWIAELKTRKPDVAIAATANRP